MTSYLFSCGCREDAEETCFRKRRLCPMHRKPAMRCAVLPAFVLKMKFGSAPDLPPGGLFYPKIEGMRTAL